MPIYEPVPQAEEPVITAASSSSAPAAAQPVTARDGVFQNLKPKTDPSPAPVGKAYEEIEPPSYADVAHDRAPAYYETTVISSGIQDDGELLIDGLPVGDFLSFIVNMLVSMSFDFIGFLLTAMLATSHAARAGSRCGFGITLVRYGFYMRAREDEVLDQYDQYDPQASPESIAEEKEETRAETEWISYLMIVMGFFIFMRANAEYVRAKRMQAVILASSEVTQV
ncbi:uncharacterized protein EV422DRAFT_566516 [Fimicolochytrium jonesii]|uniref:uncharacterized protein n=1 Tax=Fimicolochytrium jonesii TaxID=1396493 RepID=UPI0022FE7FB6|nr:uncharacterized protein EV422DRAFT_566516 [Fimicolochytrium jonesii]KAI8822081.1 hypothetical protein EV422DRAFT_566516 [Fimicolochytrium jonesii]